MRQALVSTAAAVAVVAAAWPLSATGHHRPGHEGGDPAADLTIDISPNPVLWANATTVSGRLKGPENGGKTVELQQNPWPYPGPFGVITTTTTDDQGYYSFRVAPGRHTIYRTVARGTSPDRTSPEMRARVRMRITRRVSDRTPRRGRRVTFYGAVAPAHDGQLVRIQRLGPDGRFHTVARTEAEDAGDDFPTNSFYERKLRIFRDGTWRAKVTRDDDHAGNTSRTVAIDVH
jgi:hypothetical protein